MQEGYSRLKGARWHGAGYKGDWSTADTWDPPGMSNSEMKARILHYSVLSADLEMIHVALGPHDEFACRNRLSTGAASPAIPK